jgi:hypothetical protein
MSSKYTKETFFKDVVSVDAAIDLALADDEAPADEIMDKQVLIRVSDSQRAKWQRAAEAEGSSVSDWLRQMADRRYQEIFECTHPLEMRRSYPWSEFCDKCGIRMR